MSNTKTYEIRSVNVLLYHKLFRFVHFDFLLFIIFLIPPPLTNAKSVTIPSVNIVGTIQKDGTVRYYCSSKCRKNFEMGRKNKKVKWVRKMKHAEEEVIAEIKEESESKETKTEKKAEEKKKEQEKKENGKEE